MEKKEFLKDLEAAKNRYPFLDYEYLEGKEYPYKITEDFEISDNEGNHWGTFRASVYFHSRYPKEFPLLKDLSKAFPCEADWHISPRDGDCCVCGIIEQEERARSGISILNFIDVYVLSFYANQLYKKHFGHYKNGEYAHDVEGVWEALEEEFNTKDRKEIRRFLKEMKIKRGRNTVCFCGSGVKYKRCHLDRKRIIENVIKRASSYTTALNNQQLFECL